MLDEKVENSPALSASAPDLSTSKRKPLIEWNFFRIHLLVFTIIPLIGSGIFYGANGARPVSFIDSMFLCYSAMTDTGLSVVNLSTTTSGQQVVLFLLMLVGDITVVAWVMVLVRQYFFKVKCGAMLKAERIRHDQLKSKSLPISNPSQPRPFNIPSTHGEFNLTVQEPTNAHPTLDVPEGEGVDPRKTLSMGDPTRTPASAVPSGLLWADTVSNDHSTGTHQSSVDRSHVLSDVHALTSSPPADAISLPTSPPAHVEFTPHPTMSERQGQYLRNRRPTRRGATILVNNDPLEPPLSSAQRGLGGIGVLTLSGALARRIAPDTYRRVKRQLTIPATMTYNSRMNPAEEPKADDDSVSDRPLTRMLMSKAVPWLKFDGLIVGRNSKFHTETLTHEQLEDLGGTEYRALALLGYLVPAYFVLTQVFAFLIFGPFLVASTQYNSIFESQSQYVPKSWFAAFQVASSYTGGGLSLVDTGMVPFQTCYLMIFSLVFAILAGNHGLPIFLRLVIWIGTKIVRDGSDMDETLHFLLDHPRRCFIYLFPSHVTWFLVCVLFIFTAIEWVAFIVLDIGLPVTEALPAGVRVAAGFFQSFAVRASGFAITNLAALAPAVQFLYIVMMYIAVYPVAMSIRSTNVYEEQSLGIFEASPDDEDDEPALVEGKGTRRERIAKYLSWHLRRQTSHDLWWLVVGIWLVCIIERDIIMDDVNAPWFNVFRIMFELVSGFGGIGLSLGLPYDNFSFSGSFKPLSKLVVIVIMLRGRHRGLPVAIDRSILLPRRSEYRLNEEQFPKSETV